MLYNRASSLIFTSGTLDVRLTFRLDCQGSGCCHVGYSFVGPQLCAHQVRSAGLHSLSAGGGPISSGGLSSGAVFAATTDPPQMVAALRVDAGGGAVRLSVSGAEHRYDHRSGVGGDADADLFYRTDGRYAAGGSDFPAVESRNDSGRRGAGVLCRQCDHGQWHGRGRHDWIDADPVGGRYVGQRQYSGAENTILRSPVSAPRPAGLEQPHFSDRLYCVGGAAG